MEEEIDLRPYIEALVHGWKWIVGAGIAFALAAFLVTRFIPPTYEATVFIAVADSYEIVQLDPRIRNNEERLPCSVFPDLARSDELLFTVFSRLEPVPQGIRSVAQLKGLLSADVGADCRLLIFTVRSGNAETAATIANLWAEEFIPWVNRVYGTQDVEQIAVYGDRLAQSKLALDDAELDLIEFESRNQTRTISNTLLFLTNTYAQHLLTLQNLESLQQDSQRLQEQLLRDDNVDNLSLATQLTAFSLQLNVFHGATLATSVPPFSLQINGVDSLIGTNRNEQNAFLDNLIETLSAKSGEIESEIQEFGPEMLELQRELQELETEYAHLNRERRLLEEEYLVLAKKVTEEEISSQDSFSRVRLASRASVPESSVNEFFLWIVMAGGIGVMLSMILILGQVWWVAFNTD